MKKWIVLLLVFIVVAIGCLYFFIPNRIRIHKEVIIAVNARGFSRTIQNDKKWSNWWPGEVVTQSTNEPASFRFNGSTYTIVGKRFSSFILSVKSEKDSFLTELFFIPTKPDSVALTWEGSVSAPTMPLTRLQVYYKARHLHQDMDTILYHLQSFYTKEENLYGMAIKKDFVADSILISTSATSKGYPSVESVYSLIDKLKVFAQAHGARQTGLPMLNVNTIDSITYRTQVALPVDKKLKDEDDVKYRWMLGGGRILATEIKGGPYIINNAFKEMQNYIDDFQCTAPAIPFQSLVTDRSKERDTSKWVTKLYWPVM